MARSAICRSHSVPLLSYAWDGHAYIYRCPVDKIWNRCEPTWQWDAQVDLGEKP
jgi:hypothetical protein